MKKELFIFAATISSSFLFSVPDAYAITSGHQQTATKQHSKYVKTKKSAPAVVSATSKSSGLPVFSGTFDITSNYIYRGISNSNNSPAVQGGLTATFIKGFYVSTWGSNVDFLDRDGNTVTFELDTSAGIANKIGENFNYDLHIVRYNYPNANRAAYSEFMGGLGYRYLTGYIGYSTNVFASGKSGTYYNIGAKYPISYQGPIWNNIALTGGIGYYDLPESAGLLSYADYNLGISKTIGIYNLALQWTDTNRHSVDAYNLKDSKIVGTVTVSF